MNLLEQVRNHRHRYGHFELTEEQLGVLCVEQPEFVTVVEGAMLALEPSISEEQNLHWATDNLDSLIAAIRKMRKKLQTEMTGKWKMRVYPPEFVEPLCRVGFEVHSHFARGGRLAVLVDGSGRGIQERPTHGRAQWVELSYETQRLLPNQPLQLTAGSWVFRMFSGLLRFLVCRTPFGKTPAATELGSLGRGRKRVCVPLIY